MTLNNQNINTQTGGGFTSLLCSLLLNMKSMQLAKQKLCWKLEGKEEANFSKPERIGYTQECGLLGSLFRSIDMAGKETEAVRSWRSEGLYCFELTHTLHTVAI